MSVEDRKSKWRFPPQTSPESSIEILAYQNNRAGRQPRDTGERVRHYAVKEIDAAVPTVLCPGNTLAVLLLVQPRATQTTARNDLPSTLVCQKWLVLDAHLHFSKVVQVGVFGHLMRVPLQSHLMTKLLWDKLMGVVQSSLGAWYQGIILKSWSKSGRAAVSDRIGHEFRLVRDARVAILATIDVHSLKTPSCCVNNLMPSSLMTRLASLKQSVRSSSFISEMSSSR